MGRVGQGRDAEFQKWKLRFVEGWDMRWKFRTSLGRGDVWIGVPVRCYMECQHGEIAPETDEHLFEVWAVVD